MKKPARRILSKILKKLTRAVIEKHEPTIIALVCESGTSVPREVLYQILHNHFPTRRNIESPEAEFAIPLTIIGADNYPQDVIEWLELILKTIGQLVFIPPHNNILILEMNTSLAEILDYWLEITKPEFIITCGSHPQSSYIKKEAVIEAPPADSANLEKYKNLAIRIGNSLGLSKKTIQKDFSAINLPEPRIRILPGANGNFVVDATYKYFPPLQKSLEEVLEPLSGKAIWIRSKKEWEESEARDKDVIVITGPKGKLLDIVEKAALNPLEI
jgi:hypothetical protein